MDQEVVGSNPTSRPSHPPGGPPRHPPYFSDHTFKLRLGRLSYLVVARRREFVGAWPYLRETKVPQFPLFRLDRGAPEIFSAGESAATEL